MDNTQIQTISIIIASIAAIASAVSAYYSKVSAATSKNNLEYIQAPVLFLEYKTPYFYIRNIGLGIAQSINWKGKNIDIKSNSDLTNIIIPSNIESDSDNENINLHLVLDIKEQSEGKLILAYKNLQGKIFTSEIKINRFAGHEYKTKLLKNTNSRIMKNNSFDIKAIVFDLGGVLFQEGKSIAIEKLSKEKNYDKNVVLNIVKSPKSFDLRAGIINDEEFWNFAQKQLPEGYNAITIKNYWYDGYVLDENIFNLVKKLHRKYKLFIFSGNIKSRVEYLEKKYNFRKYFDLEVYSYDCHLNKPQKEFVDVLIKKSRLYPQEMIFIDDNEEVLNPAEELGMKTIVYKTGNINNLENKLKSFGVSI